MKKIISLCKNYEFQKLYHKGNSSIKPTLVMYALKGRKNQIRLGLTAGKKIGGAVYRNRAKRRIRELFRITQDKIIQGIDICIVARSQTLTASHEKLCKDFHEALRELNLLNDEKDAN